VNDQIKFIVTVPWGNHPDIIKILDLKGIQVQCTRGNEILTCANAEDFFGQLFLRIERLETEVLSLKDLMGE
jgi:hypothetical protein